MAATVDPRALLMLVAEHGWDAGLSGTADGSQVLEATRGTVELTVRLREDAGGYSVSGWVRDDRAESGPGTSAGGSAGVLLAQVREMVTRDPLRG